MLISHQGCSFGLIFDQEGLVLPHIYLMEVNLQLGQILIWVLYPFDKLSMRNVLILRPEALGINDMVKMLLQLPSVVKSAGDIRLCLSLISLVLLDSAIDTKVLYLLVVDLDLLDNRDSIFWCARRFQIPRR